MLIRLIKIECCSGSIEIQRNPGLINVILDTKDDCGSVMPKRGYVMFLVSCWYNFEKVIEKFLIGNLENISGTYLRCHG